MDSIKKQAMIKTAAIVAFAAAIGGLTSVVIEYAGLQVIMGAFALVAVVCAIKILYDYIEFQLMIKRGQNPGEKKIGG